jgi:TATA-binding protein-associated factor Taf7
MTSNSGDGLAAFAAGTASSPLVGADGSARGRSSSSDELEDSDDEEEAKSHSQKELVLPEEEDDDEEDEEWDEEEAEEELEDVEGLLLARFFDRLAGGLATRTGSTPAAVNRNWLPSRSS